MQATKEKLLNKKQVREFTEVSNVDAYVILKDGQHIATVQSFRSKGATVYVDIYDKSKLIFQGRAGGYGYDKFAAAIRGAEIDGHKIYDHSEGVCVFTKDVPETYDRHPELFALYKAYRKQPKNESKWNKEVEKVGARFTNWTSENGGYYQSLYYENGIDRLKSLGYTVIQAI